MWGFLYLRIVLIDKPSIHPKKIGSKQNTFATTSVIVGVPSDREQEHFQTFMRILVHLVNEI